MFVAEGALRRGCSDSPLNGGSPPCFSSICPWRLPHLASRSHAPCEVPHAVRLLPRTELRCPRWRFRAPASKGGQLPGTIGLTGYYGNYQPTNVSLKQCTISPSGRDLRFDQRLNHGCVASAWSEASRRAAACKPSRACTNRSRHVWSDALADKSLPCASAKCARTAAGLGPPADLRASTFAAGSRHARAASSSTPIGLPNSLTAAASTIPASIRSAVMPRSRALRTTAPTT